MFSAVPRASIGPFGPGTAAKSVAGQVAERVGGEDWIQGRDVGKLWQRLTGWWFGTIEFYDFPYIGKNNPNWRTHMFQNFNGI